MSKLEVQRLDRVLGYVFISLTNENSLSRARQSAEETLLFGLISMVFGIMGGLRIHGLIPGPELFTRFGVITYGFILSLFLSNIFFLILGLFFAPLFAKISTISNTILIPAVMILSVIGSYAINNSLFDVWVMLVFGIAGYFLDRAGFSLGAIVLGLILGPIAELGFGQSLIISNGNPVIFINHPLAVILLVITVALLLPGFIGRSAKRKGGDTLTALTDKLKE